jgi:MFS family permease
LISTVPDRLSPHFWRFWTAVVASNLGDGVALAAIPWVATQVTSDPVAVAGVATAGRLPWLLLVIPAGVVIDRGGWSRIMQRASLARTIALVILGLLLTQAISLPALLLFAFVLGTTEVLFDTAADAAVPSLVKPEHLPRANGHVRAGEIITNDFAGRPLGGVLLTVGASLPFLFNAVAAAIATIALLALRRGTDDAVGPATPVPQAWRAEMRDGFTFTWSHPTLRYLALLVTVMSWLYTAMLGTQVLFVQRILHAGPVGFAVLITVASLGALLGTQLARHAVARLGKAGGLLAPIGVMGLSFAAIGASSDYWLVALLYTTASAAVVVFSVVRESIRQSETPQALLGRVGATFRFLSWGVSALGLLSSGLLVAFAEGWGPTFALRAPYFVAAVGFGAVLLLSIPRMSRLLEGGRP